MAGSVGSLQFVQQRKQERPVLLGRGVRVRGDMHEQAGNVVARSELLHAAVVDVVAQIAAGIVADLNFVCLSLRLFVPAATFRGARD